MTSKERQREIILKLKMYRAENDLSYAQIVSMVEANGDFISKSTVAKVFADGSEDENFRFNTSIKPISDALLGVNAISDTDSTKEQAMKELLQYKYEKLEELEADLNKEKVKYHEKLEKERARSQKSIDFLKTQIELKDKRIDFLFDEVAKKDELLLEYMRKAEK